MDFHHSLQAEEAEASKNRLVLQFERVAETTPLAWPRVTRAPAKAWFFRSASSVSSAIESCFFRREVICR